MFKFKPRFLMSKEERYKIDAQYADIADFRREIAAMTANQRKRLLDDLVGASRFLRRRMNADLLGFISLLGVLPLLAGCAHGDPFFVGACAVLLPLPIMRLYDVFTLSRESFFANELQIEELGAPAEAPRSID